MFPRIDVFRKFCIVELFLKVVREVDVAQILGPARPVVRAAALLMPQANLSVHRGVRECKTLWAILRGEADTGLEEVPATSKPGLP